MHAPPIGGQPECGHTPEKRSVTTFFHQRPPSRLHVTTFPQSGDTDGEAVTTSRLRPARPQAQRCARGAVMCGAIGAAVGPAGKKPPQAGRLLQQPPVRQLCHTFQTQGDPSDHKGRGRWERLRFESTRLRPGVRCDFRSPRNSKNPKERQRAQRPGHSALTIVQRSIEGGSRDEAALSAVRGVRAPTGGYLTPSVVMSRSALTGSRTEENREALSDYRERLLKRRPFRVRVRSAPPEARHWFQIDHRTIIIMQRSSDRIGTAIFTNRWRHTRSDPC